MAVSASPFKLWLDMFWVQALPQLDMLQPRDFGESFSQAEAIAHYSDLFHDILQRNGYYSVYDLKQMTEDDWDDLEMTLRYKNALEEKIQELKKVDYYLNDNGCRYV